MNSNYADDTKNTYYTFGIVFILKNRPHSSRSSHLLLFFNAGKATNSNP